MVVHQLGLEAALRHLGQPCDIQPIAPDLSWLVSQSCDIWRLRSYILDHLRDKFCSQRIWLPDGNTYRQKFFYNLRYPFSKLSKENTSFRYGWVANVLPFLIAEVSITKGLYANSLKCPSRETQPTTYQDANSHLTSNVINRWKVDGYVSPSQSVILGCRVAERLPYKRGKAPPPRYPYLEGVKIDTRQLT